MKKVKSSTVARGNMEKVKVNGNATRYFGDNPAIGKGQELRGTPKMAKTKEKWNKM